MKVWCCVQVGFQCIDQLAAAASIPLDKKQHNALVGKGMLFGRKAVLAKPQTFMNSSGKSVRKLMDFYKVHTLPPDFELRHHQYLLSGVLLTDMFGGIVWKSSASLHACERLHGSTCSWTHVYLQAHFSAQHHSCNYAMTRPEHHHEWFWRLSGNGLSKG